MNRKMNAFIFLLDKGTVQKVVVLPGNSSTSGELILEELEVFKVWHHLLISKSEHVYIPFLSDRLGLISKTIDKIAGVVMCVCVSWD